MDPEYEALLTEAKSLESNIASCGVPPMPELLGDYYPLRDRGRELVKREAFI